MAVSISVLWLCHLLRFILFFDSLEFEGLYVCICHLTSLKWFLFELLYAAMSVGDSVRVHVHSRIQEEMISSFMCLHPFCVSTVGRYSVKERRVSEAHSRL